MVGCLKKSFLSKRGIEAYITVSCAVVVYTLLWLSHVLVNGFRCLSKLYEFYAMLCFEVHLLKPLPLLALIITREYSKGMPTQV